MKRIGAFLLGILVGIILIIGGIAVALFSISPSTFGIDLNDEWVTEDNKQLDKTSFADIIASGINMLSSDELTLQQIQNTYGIDLLKELGLEGENYTSLKNQTLTNITNNPQDALSGVKLADLLNGKLGQTFESIPDSLKEIWEANGISLGDLFGENVLSKLLAGVKLSDLSESLKTSTGLTKIIADKDLGTIIEDLKKENNDFIKSLFQDVFVGELINYSFLQETNTISNLTEIVPGVYSNGFIYFRLKANSEETRYYLAELNCFVENHIHTEDCFKPVWKDANDAEPTALMSTFASIELDDLLSGNFSIDAELENLRVGEILDYTWDSLNGYWMSNGKEVSVLFNNIYSKTIKDLQNGIDVNDMLEGVKVSDVITINQSDPILLQIIADKEILDLSTEIEHIYCGEMQEFELKEVDVSAYSDLTPGVKFITEGGVTLYSKQHHDGKWYEAEQNCWKTKDHTTSNDHTEICYEFVWYNYDSSVEGNYVKVTGIDKVIANSTIADLSIDDIVKKIKTLPYTEVITETTGAFTLIAPTTTINDLPTALTNAINTKSVGELMNAGLFSLSTETQNIFNTTIPDWKNMTVSEFLNTLSQKLNQIP